MPEGEHGNSSEGKSEAEAQRDTERRNEEIQRAAERIIAEHTAALTEAGIRELVNQATEGVQTLTDAALTATGEALVTSLATVIPQPAASFIVDTAVSAASEVMRSLRGDVAEVIASGGEEQNRNANTELAGQVFGAAIAFVATGGTVSVPILIGLAISIAQSQARPNNLNALPPLTAGPTGEGIEAFKTVFLAWHNLPEEVWWKSFSDYVVLCSYLTLRDQIVQLQTIMAISPIVPVYWDSEKDRYAIISSLIDFYEKSSTTHVAQVYLEVTNMRYIDFQGNEKPLPRAEAANLLVYAMGKIMLTSIHTGFPIKRSAMMSLTAARAKLTSNNEKEENAGKGRLNFVDSLRSAATQFGNIKDSSEALDKVMNLLDGSVFVEAGEKVLEETLSLFSQLPKIVSLAMDDAERQMVQALHELVSFLQEALNSLQEGVSEQAADRDAKTQLTCRVLQMATGVNVAMSSSPSTMSVTVALGAVQQVKAQSNQKAAVDGDASNDEGYAAFMDLILSWQYSSEESWWKDYSEFIMQNDDITLRDQIIMLETVKFISPVVEDQVSWDSEEDLYSMISDLVAFYEQSSTAHIAQLYLQAPALQYKHFPLPRVEAAGILALVLAKIMMIAKESNNAPVKRASISSALMLGGSQDKVLLKNLRGAVCFY